MFEFVGEKIIPGYLGWMHTLDTLHLFPLDD
jgi:hypothetical protein